MSMFKDFNVTYVYVTDWEKAKKFYREVLEWPVFWSNDEVGWEEYGLENEAHLAINLWRGADAPQKGGAIPVLTVDDPYHVTEALKAKGVKVSEVVHIPGVVTYGAFFDPEGNQIQFAGGQM